jgi:hypothetical protein
MIFYMFAAASCFWCWRRERAVRDLATLWPWFWLLTGLLVAALGVAQIAGLGGAVTDAGRGQAQAEGWYAARRVVQGIAVGGLATAWAASTVVAVWRFPARRRRYLPPTLIVVFLVCFTAVRLVSLHHVDQVLFNREWLGIRPVTWIETAVLLAISAVAVHAAAWLPRRATRSTPRAVEERAA